MPEATVIRPSDQSNSSWSSWVWLSNPFASTASKDASVSPLVAAAEPQPAPTVEADTRSDGKSSGEIVAPLDMAGTWQKDEDASDQDKYAQQVQMLHMSALYTYAALHYMWGLEIKPDDAGFSKKYLVKKVPAYIFSEVETFRFDEQTTMGRRDRRSGSQTATASKGKDSNVVDIAWGEPYAGTVKEEYTMPSPQVLHITSTLTMGDTTVTALQVYNKK